MLQSLAARTLAVTVSSLLITILLYLTITHVETRTPIPSQPSSGWGDGWASLLAPGEPLERTIMRSPSGQYVFSIESNGDLVFQDRKSGRSTTLFGQDGPSGGLHGLGDGVQVPENARWHGVLTKRGIFVVYFDVAKSPDGSVSIDSRSDLMKTENKRDDPNGGVDKDEPNHGLGKLSFTAWDSNRLEGCHILPKHAPAGSVPFLQLDDRGFLAISTANEINCILQRGEGREPKKS